MKLGIGLIGSRNLLTRHVALPGSVHAQSLLDDWAETAAVL